MLVRLPKHEDRFQTLQMRHAALYFAHVFDTLLNMTIRTAKKADKLDSVWQTIRKETACEVEREPVLASFLHATILNHDTLETALSFHLAHSLASPAASALRRESMHRP